MTKTDMVDGIAKAAGITKKAAAAALEAVTDLIAKDLKKGTNDAPGASAGGTRADHQDALPARLYR